MVKALLGGKVPPVMWDGVTAFAGMPGVAKVRISDGPVLNLNLPTPGDVEKAKPTITPTVGDAQVAEPKAVVLPKAQADLGA